MAGRTHDRRIAFARVMSCLWIVGKLSAPAPALTVLAMGNGHRETLHTFVEMCGLDVLYTRPV